MNCYVGIDPGQHGAVAFLYPSEPPVVVDLPIRDGELDVMAFLSLLGEHLPSRDGCRVGLERPGWVPGQTPVKTLRSCAAMDASLRTLLVVRGIPYQYVAAKDWQSECLRGEPLGEAKGPERRKAIKAASMRVAGRLFPSVELGRKDGRADALLIAEYLRRQGGER